MVLARGVRFLHTSSEEPQHHVSSAHTAPSRDDALTVLPPSQHSFVQESLTSDFPARNWWTARWIFMIYMNKKNDAMKCWPYSFQDRLKPEVFPPYFHTQGTKRQQELQALTFGFPRPKLQSGHLYSLNTTCKGEETRTIQKSSNPDKAKSKSQSYLNT